MKKLTAILLAAAMILTLAGCDNSELADANRRLQEQIDDLQREQQTTTAPATTGEPSADNIGFTVTTPAGWGATVQYEFGTSIDSRTITWGAYCDVNSADVVIVMMTEKAVEDEFGEKLSNISLQRLLDWYFEEVWGFLLSEQTEVTLAGMQAIRAKFSDDEHDGIIYVAKHEQAAFFIITMGNTETILNSFRLCSDIPLQNVNSLEIRFPNDDILKNNEILAELVAGVGMQSLTYLGISDNSQISDISPLAGLTNLRKLYLSQNQITDISSLAGLTNLEHLELANNQISDLTPLAGFTNLTELYLQSNQISDISPLAGLTNLERLHLRGNPIPDRQIQELRAALPNTQIDFW
jgi:hypothetical protein